MDANAIAHARERASAAGFTNIEFVQGNLADYRPTDKLDAIVGRLVLLYQPDPAAALAGTCIVETMRRSGAHLDVGPRLHRIFTAAGLPVPSMRGEILMDGRPEEKLPALVRDELQTYGYTMTVGPIVAAWCRR